ncbi:MAG: hypothetical protein ABI791_16055 [Acidobacteriota bacterium]
MKEGEHLIGKDIAERPPSPPDDELLDAYSGSVVASGYIQGF